jgi:glycosyltransferase involved in cell wall biosynthesis
VTPARTATGRRRALVLTSHPLDARDGADKELSLTIASGMPDVDFTWFGKVGARRREPLRSGRRVPLLSPSGMPGPFERLQAAGLALLLDRHVDLVHAVVTVGPRFAEFVRLRERVLGPTRRPAIHTVPAVADVAGLRGSRALGTTVTLSRATQSALLDAGFPDVRLIPPGIDLSRWPARARAEGSAPVVAFAGHYDLEGGLWESVQALGSLAREGQRIRGMFLMRPRPGQDENREAAALLARARESGLDDVRVHGRTPDMPAMLARVDILLLPARELGGKADVPLTVLEAMASGRPVVVTDLPQMSALGAGATRVPVGDAAALADAVRALLGQPLRWEAMVRAGRAVVAEQFSADLMVRRYAELYDEVLSARPASSEPGSASSAPLADTG